MHKRVISRLKLSELCQGKIDFKSNIFIKFQKTKEANFALAISIKYNKKKTFETASPHEKTYLSKMVKSNSITETY